MERSARVRNALLIASGVLASLVVVAIAARGRTPAGDDRTRSPGDTLLDVFFTLYLLAMAAGAALLVYLLVLHRRMRIQRQEVRKRGIVELVATFFFLLALALFLGRRLLEYERRPLDEPDGTDIVGGLGTATSADSTAYEPRFAWLPALLTVGLIVLALVGWWLAARARRRARGELRPGFVRAVAQAVELSLDDLRAERDPRRAVIAAYARLEQVLAAHGLPRAPSEAPLEYLARMLAELDVREESARRLTDLFERAKFSQHAVGPQMKEEAIVALESVRDELRAAEEERERARKAALAAGGPKVVS